jgi:hypothetical protein
MKSTKWLPARRRHGRARWMLGAAVGIGACSHAGAHVYCVSTAALLQDALTQSSDGGAHDDEDNVILLTAGTFKTGAVTSNGPFRYHGSSSRHFDLFGGYDANCNATSYDPRRSVLDGDHTTAVLEVHSTDGPVDLAWFTARNGESDAAGAGISVNRLAGDDSQATLEGLIIRDNHTTATAGGFFVQSGPGDLLLVLDSLVVGNSADSGFGAGSAIAGGAATIGDLTVAQNTTTLAGGVGGLRVAGANGYSCGVDDSILWGNTQAGLFLGNSNVHLDHDDVGTLDGAAPSSQNSVISVNPQFVDAPGGDFHLKSTSPALGFAQDGFGGHDAEGHPSAPYRSFVDIGSLFDTIFDYGMD